MRRGLQHLPDARLLDLRSILSSMNCILPDAARPLWRFTPTTRTARSRSSPFGAIHDVTPSFPMNGTSGHAGAAQDLLCPASMGIDGHVRNSIMIIAPYSKHRFRTVGASGHPDFSPPCRGKVWMYQMYRKIPTFLQGDPPLGAEQGGVFWAPMGFSPYSDTSDTEGYASPPCRGKPRIKALP